MATNASSHEISGPRKRKLSTKASTNGDPLEAKRKKKLRVLNNVETEALTKKKKASEVHQPVEDEEMDDEGSDRNEVDMEPATEVISIDDSDDDEDTEDETNLEVKEETAETEMGTNFFFMYLIKLTRNHSERLSKEWTAPIYVFFRNEPRIELVNDRRVHVFMCAAGRCRGKNGRDVRRFLDKGDARSTSGLRRHAKNCWGIEAVEAADATKDLESARLVLTKTKLRDGSITAQFERIGKGKVTFSHRQHTTTESR